MSNRSNRIEVPESRQALENMKFEVANELGVNLSMGYNGDVSAKDNGRVGGQMVRRMIEDYQRQAAGKNN